MKKKVRKIAYRIPLLLSLVLLLASCRCKQQAIPSVEPVVLHERDSVRTEYIERVRIDTLRVEIPIPAQSASEVVRDSVSFLETDFATSVARILSDGSLSHTLKNKERNFEADALVAVKDTETAETEYVYRDKPVKVPYAVEVEKELTGWQKFRLGAFWWLLGVAVALGLWTFRRFIPIFK